MEMNIDKVYDPKKTEDKWYEFWLDNDMFRADIDHEKEMFCVMIPPPNVTGVLHMGHALQSTLQDAITRFYRMEGLVSLWVPGTDHAGIATQNVVEKKLLEEGIAREDLGREKFLEHVWDWKEKHGSVIKTQLEKLGSSCDWSRERFTFDEGLSAAVKEVFYRLYKKGMVYRGNYIVNWCPRCKTAIADDEVKHVDKNSHLWYIKYPLKDSDDFITVATTRPETMLGDTAVAVNSDDERYKKYHGRTVVLPILGREITVITDDEYVDPKFGTGAVKVTPAHDPNDFAMGRKHRLQEITVIDENAAMTEHAGPKYKGMDRFECRKQLVKDLQEQGYLLKIEDHAHAVGQCYRCKNVIEPKISMQWFVKMKPMAEKAIEVVKNGKIKIFPQRWEKVYFSWLENIRDWCISRQLWWGHRIPVWYCDDCGAEIVSTGSPEECIKCGSKNIRQDEDVLDTWFSSWLWPFSTLGWPEETEDLKYFYPTTVLISAYDILFFWMARMIMAGLEFMEEIPYKHMYLTGMIVDEQGRPFSKSLGNGIDPLVIIEKYGADALRYSLVALCTEGQDMRLSEQRFEMGRNFGNKLWNAFRFLKSKETEAGTAPVTRNDYNIELADRWILSRANAVTNTVKDLYRRYKFSDALSTVHNFFWHEFCDWYLELIKDRITTEEGEAGRFVYQKIAIPVFEQVLKLLHPVMPFITEEIWHGLRDGKRESIMREKADVLWDALADETAESDMNTLQNVIKGILNIRGEMNIPHNKTASVIVNCADISQIGVLSENENYIKKMGRVDSITCGTGIAKPDASAASVVEGMEIFVPLAGLIDIDKEKERLTKEINRLCGILNGISKKLSNENFLKKAPEQVIANEREKEEGIRQNLTKLKDNLKTLGA